MSFLAAPQPAGAYPPQPPTRSIDVAAAGQICNADAPFIAYEIVTTGFELSEAAGLTATLTATVTILDSTGTTVAGPLPGLPLVGELLYPGASVDSSGRGIDWPGWQLVDGVWVPDSSDAHLTSGLRVQAVVESSTAMTAVQYPTDAQVCLSPSGQSSPPSGSVGSAGGSLPDTGGTDPTRILWIALAALLGGGVILAASHRRHGAVKTGN